MGRRRIFILLLLIYALTALIRLTALTDIDNRDQAKQGLYVLDVVQNGIFFLPTELGGRPSTKPPLYTWVAAGISQVWGKVTDLTIRLPAIFSGLGVVVITFLIAEMLFSREVGLFAGLILIISEPFIDLSSLARTDMMQCFFISLSLYLFLLAYRERSKKKVYSILMFVAMGLGSITKSPVAFLLPVLIILVFLFLMKDLKWVRSIPFGLGIAIWLGIVLSWFIPALITGGRDYFNIVILHEMINRFFGTGTRTEKTRPVYYLIGHFFGKFLPWSLFVPSSIVRYWKSKDETEKSGLLFPIVCLLTIMIFFSVSRGKRADYLLPLYPAASIILGQFWFVLTQSDEARQWNGHLIVLSLGYLVMIFCLTAILAAILVRPDLTQYLSLLGPRRSETLELYYRSISRSSRLLLPIVFTLGLTSALGVLLASRGRLKGLFMVLSIVTALNLTLYFEILSPEVRTMSGEQKKAFCSAVGKIDSIENLQFLNVEPSILFYTSHNVRLLDHREALEYFQKSDNPHLITTETDYIALRDSIDFELIVLEESEYLTREKTKYILLTKKKPNV